MRTRRQHKYDTRKRTAQRSSSANGPPCVPARLCEGAWGDRVWVAQRAAQNENEPLKQIYHPGAANSWNRARPPAGVTPHVK